MQPDKSVLAIDRNNLDEESAGSPQLVFLWGEELALARRRARDAERALEVSKLEAKRILGELSLKIRLDPTKYGLVKATETSLEARALTRSEYQDALADIQRKHEDYSQAKEDEDVLFAFVMALNDRKEQIATLARLFHDQYWFRAPIDQAKRGLPIQGAGRESK